MIRGYPRLFRNEPSAFVVEPLDFSSHRLQSRDPCLCGSFPRRMAFMICQKWHAACGIQLWKIEYCIELIQ